jgi:hypothetical protein
MKTLEIKHQTIIFDDEIFESINKLNLKISLVQINNKIYAKINNYYLHRKITNAKKNEVVDHINGNSLDNRRENLRICSIKQNVRNSQISKNNKVGYKGVYIDKRRTKKYIVNIMVDYQKIYIGAYYTAEEAALNYNKAAIKYFGEYANINNVIKPIDLSIKRPNAWNKGISKYTIEDKKKMLIDKQRNYRKKIKQNKLQ